MHASASWPPLNAASIAMESGKATMDDIACEVGLSRPSVYRYFADRDDLLIELISRHARALLDRAHKTISRQSSLPDQIIESLL